MKVWFCQSCEMILSTVEDMGSDCGDMYCTTCPYLINEVTRHKQDGCKVVFVPKEWIKTVRLSRRVDNVIRPATVEELEEIFIKEGGLGINFARGLAEITLIERKIVRP